MAVMTFLFVFTNICWPRWIKINQISDFSRFFKVQKIQNAGLSVDTTKVAHQQYYLTDNVLVDLSSKNGNSIDTRIPKITGDKTK